MTQKTQGKNSLACSIAMLPEQERRKAINSLSEKEAVSRLHDWTVWAMTELMLGEEEQETIVVFDAIKEFGLTELGL